VPNSRVIANIKPSTAAAAAAEGQCGSNNRAMLDQAEIAVQCAPAAASITTSDTTYAATQSSNVVNVGPGTY
jgi:hypothetical protein